MLECSVRPENVAMLTGFGWFVIVCGAVSLLTGATYFRRVIRREEEPRGFWVVTGGLFILGAYVLFMLLACGRG
jgi:hypothetical protein